MKIAYISTYPPRECGIGTFTHHLARSMHTDGNEIMVVAMNDHDLEYEYPPEVNFVVNQDNQDDYLMAADFINESGADACVLEHEFGIYGGTSGIYILTLLHRLKIPVISTFHTILDKPTYNEKTILQEICRMSEKVVVMSRKAVYFLKRVYEIPDEKIKIIEHGVPDIHFDKIESRKELGFSKRKMLLTFGFVGRNKGIETVIKALPQVIDKHPEVLYVILGKTHPNVLRSSGEDYREYLQELIEKLELNEHVVMVNEFADEKKLFKYLFSCDIYITPYPGVAQITSGTLTYAMGSGCAVVSTPFWHASELLRNNRGCLFNFNDSDDLADNLDELLEKPEKLKEIQANAYSYGQHITWPKIGKEYVDEIKTILSKPKKAAKREELLNPLLLPPFSLTHIKRLTDKTGIIQHAKYGIPDFKEGYCLDDNARALLMVCLHYKQDEDPEALELMTVYLSYIGYMQNQDGSFRNFMSFSREFLDEVGSEDAFGRAIWGLGYLLSNAPNDAYYQAGKVIFFKALPYFKKIKSIRSIAYMMIGIAHYLEMHSSDDRLKSELERMATDLVNHYEQNQSENWRWFEPILTYDNAILPLSLLHASGILKNKKVKEVAFASMDFLTYHTIKNDQLSIIGNHGWYKKDGKRAKYAQQPLDALSMVLMFHQAYKLTANYEFMKKLFISFSWFLGENDIRMSLYDHETESCCDGFEQEGVNRNQGAESSLAYLIAHLTVMEAYEESYLLRRNRIVLNLTKSRSEGVHESEDNIALKRVPK